MVMGFLTSIYTWMIATFLFIILFVLLLILLIILAKKTHAIIELKAWISGNPICIFFEETRYCVWKPKKSDCGIIEDKNYGSFIINEKATYVDKLTKNVIIPFDATFGASLNVRAAKLADDLQFVAKDEEQMKMLRTAIALNQISDAQVIDGLKTSIAFGAIKTMMTALLPHAITSKIEKTIAARMKNTMQINPWQIVLIFLAILGAIIIGAIALKMFAK